MRGLMMSRSIKVVAVTLVLLLLTACSPDFRTPVAWGGGKKIVPGGMFDDPMRVEIYDDGVGYVENLPQGVAEKTPDDHTCTRVTSDKRYSGEVSWQVVNEHAIEIMFNGSQYLITDAPGKFASQSWDVIRIWPCGEGAGYWQLGVSCGFVGEQYKVYDLPECPVRE